MNENTAAVLIVFGVLALTGFVFYLTNSWFSLVILSGLSVATGITPECDCKCGDKEKVGV
ncbi:hypothetical protein [Bacillus sp. NEAU-Y102]